MQSSGLVSTMHLTVAGSGLGEVLSGISTGLQVSALFLNDDQPLGQNFLPFSLLLSPPHHSGAPLSHLLGFITLKNNTPVALQLQRSCTFPPTQGWKVSLLTEGLLLFFKGNPSLEPGKVCGTFQGRNGKWENQLCDRKLGYICQKRNTSLDSSTITSGVLVKS